MQFSVWIKIELDCTLSLCLSKHRNQYMILKLSWWLTLIQFSLAISHVSSLKINISGTSSIPVIRIWFNISTRLSYPVRVFKTKRKGGGGVESSPCLAWPCWIGMSVYCLIMSITGYQDWRSETTVHVKFFVCWGWTCSQLLLLLHGP